MHVVLSGKQSVLRVAAHELTHWGKNKNAAAYSSLREHLINEVGEEDFSVDLPKFLSYVEREANTRKQGEGVFGPYIQDEIDTIAGNIVDAVSDMYSAKTGVAYSLDTDERIEKGNSTGKIRK